MVKVLDYDVANMTENTKALAAEEGPPIWYLAEKDTWNGPFKATELLDKARVGSISWDAFVWKKGLPGWTRMNQIEPFQKWSPSSPKAPPVGEPKVEAVASEVTASSNRRYFLYQDQAQTGPFQMSEVMRLVHLGKISRQSFLWHEGLKDWKAFQEFEEFRDSKAETDAKPSALGRMSLERRNAPRRPFIAQIRVSNNETVITGLCRDISIGGMQVLTDRIPGVVGTALKLNVSEAQETASDFIPFVAEGVVVRILEDGKGFSLRFTKISDEGRASIEKHLENEYQ